MSTTPTFPVVRADGSVYDPGPCRRGHPWPCGFGCGRGTGPEQRAVDATLIERSIPDELREFNRSTDTLSEDHR